MMSFNHMTMTARSGDLMAGMETWQGKFFRYPWIQRIVK